MKSWMRAASVLILGTPLWALAADKPAPKATSPTTRQTTCPVTGEAVKPDVSTDYEGHNVLFCCKDCVSKFKEKPESFLPALYKQWYPQSVQVKCPIMGGPVDGKTFVDFKGQQIAFCCDGCNDKFTAQPAKYLAKLQKLSTTHVHCPVTGQPIDPKISTEYKGKPVYFSSKEAQAKFQADPAKYADKLLLEQGVVARGATADDDLVLCPICAERGGAAHQRKQVQSVVLNGKTYFTCSSNCESKLKTETAKYDAILQKQTQQAATAKRPTNLQPLEQASDGGKKYPPSEHGGHGCQHGHH